MSILEEYTKLYCYWSPMFTTAGYHNIGTHGRQHRNDMFIDTYQVVV